MRRKPLFPPPHNAAGKRLANKGRQAKSVLTINGRVELWRRWWHGAQTGSVAPADEFMNAQAETVTPGVREMACRENQVGSFDTAAANLVRTAQIKMCGEQLRLLVEREGRQVLEMQQAATLDTAWTAEDCHVEGEKTRVYVGCDGVMMPVITDAEKRLRRKKTKEKRQKSGRKCRPLPPLRKGSDLSWKELKVVYFYSEDMQHQHVAVTHRNSRAAGHLLRREADRLGFRRAAERIGNIDGAPWIREEMQHHLAELDGLGLDFYHLSEHVHEARRTVYGAESAEGDAWVGQVLHEFKHGGYESAWESLMHWRTGLPRSAKKRKAADQLLHYVSERREMILYPEFRSKGWQIGSGPTESQCKLSVDRLKGRGRRWDRPNAIAITALDSLRRSSQWNIYFQTPCPLPP